MKILFIGDIFGSTGRQALRSLLPGLSEELAPDLVVANCENAAAGAGITPKIYEEILSYGVDFLTSGNHIWQRPEVYSFIATEGVRLVRPANYPEGAPGSGYAVAKARDETRVGIVNLLGRVNLQNVDCPFRSADKALEALAGETDCVIVDFHAETTSEKVALGWYLDGRASAVIGTHTHVPTADGRVLPGGTAYLTDVGMTGSMDSIIGLERRRMIQRFVSGLPVRYEPSRENPGIDSVLVEVGADGRAVSIRTDRRFVGK